MKTQALQNLARELLAGGRVDQVIGYEVGSRGRTRPAFVSYAEDVDRLVINQDCTHNLTVYLKDLRTDPERRVGVVVKACDSRTINIMLAENKLERQQVHIIGLTCERDSKGAGFTAKTSRYLQGRCKSCTDREPIIYDVLIGEPVEHLRSLPSRHDDQLAQIENLSPADRTNFWLSQFDRCIRCYACRQVCPMCDCPTCLYERNDDLWVGAGITVDQKRSFHLGRAFHLAGRCVGCGECERVCPMEIPIGLLNKMLAKEVQAMFGYRAGLQPELSPLTTILSDEGGDR